MTIKARGAVARIPAAPVEIEEFTLDDPDPHDVVVRILASGVCYTDLGIKSGTYGTSGFPFCWGTRGQASSKRSASPKLWSKPCSVEIWPAPVSSSACPARDFPILADWYRQGKLDLDGLVSRIISLEDTEAAFEAMKRGETLRSVIVFDN